MLFPFPIRLKFDILPKVCNLSFVSADFLDYGCYLLFHYFQCFLGVPCFQVIFLVSDLNMLILFSNWLFHFDGTLFDFLSCLLIFHPRYSVTIAAVLYMNWLFNLRVCEKAADIAYFVYSHIFSKITMICLLSVVSVPCMCQNLQYDEHVVVTEAPPPFYRQWLCRFIQKGWGFNHRTAGKLEQGKKRSKEEKDQYEEILKELSMFHLKKRWMRGNMITFLKYVKTVTSNEVLKVLNKNM